MLDTNSLNDFRNYLNSKKEGDANRHLIKLATINTLLQFDILEVLTDNFRQEKATKETPAKSK